MIIVIKVVHYLMDSVVCVLLSLLKESYTLSCIGYTETY
jgi:hypothetical protein